MESERLPWWDHHRPVTATAKHPPRPARTARGEGEESSPVCVEDVGVGCVWYRSVLTDPFTKKSQHP